MTRQSIPVIDRIMRRLDVADCWVFTGAKTAAGYGAVGLGGRVAGIGLVHRIVYAHLVGPIPEGMQIDHLCRNRACCNPDHLEAVLPLVNVRRGISPANHARIRHTHCRRGHEFTPENTVTTKRQRYCKTCRSESERRRREVAKNA